MRLSLSPKRPPEERLLWSRDIRFVRRLAPMVHGCRVVELESGSILVAPAAVLTDIVVADVAAAARDAEYGMVTVDATIPERDRYLLATSAAVQVSGLAGRIGMAQSSQVVQTKMLDYFFSLRTLHRVAFQPIIELATGRLHEYECMFRPEMPNLPQSISSIVTAAIDTERSIELDQFIVATILDRAGRLEAATGSTDPAPEPATPAAPRRFAINLNPTSLLDPAFEAKTFASMVRGAGLEPARITIECTEQQSVGDLEPLKRQVKALRRLGFGFAVDDAGAGYASFTLIAALRPTIIKIDREIVHGVARDDAKQALVEAFVSFSARIGARLVAEGIENRADLASLTALRVDYGQGYLIGRPSFEPGRPRRLEHLRRRATRVPSRA